MQISIAKIILAILMIINVRRKDTLERVEGWLFILVLISAMLFARVN